jgi:plasmid stability protein
MATLTIRNLSADIYERLKQRARRHRRSITQEAAFLIEQAVSGAEGRAVWQRVDAVREHLRGTYGSFPDSAPSIAEDRER